MERLRTHHLSRRTFVVGTAGVVGSALLAACGSDDDPEPTSTPASEAPSGNDDATPESDVDETEETPAADEPTEEDDETGDSGAEGDDEPTIASQIDHDNIQQGGHVTFGINGDVTTFMPILVTDGNSRSVTGLVFDTLVVPDPDTLQAAPRMAESWEVSDDGLTYTFTLREGITWHDGEPFTADDVKFTYDTAAIPETGSTSSASLIARVASVEAPDPQTVVFTLTKPNAPFLIADLGEHIMPKHLLGDLAPEDFMTHPLAQEPIGTGPFKFEERRVGEYVRLVKNPDYYLGAPALDEVIIRVTRDNTSAYQQLKTGELDALPVTPAFYEDAKNQSNLNLRLSKGFGFQFLGFNLDETKGSPHLQDVRVRQALCYAIDREGIVRSIENGLAEVAIGLYPSISWAHQPDQIELHYPYDPEKAEELLEEAGWVKGSDGIREKDGERLSFVMASLAGSKRFEGFTSVIQENWKNVGVEMTVELDEFQAFIARVTSTFEYEIFILGTGASFDPDSTSLWATDQYPNGNNLVKYSNPRVDELLQQGIETLDVDERTAIYVELQNIILEDMPMFITTFSTTINGINKRLKNYIPNAVDDFAYQNAHLWYVTDEA